MDFKNEIASLITKFVPLESGEIFDMLEMPPEGMGDYAFPCFKLSKQMRKAPNIIAEDISKVIEKPNFISEIKAQGPYVNIYLDQSVFSAYVLKMVFEKKLNFGCSDIGDKKTVVIDYSSPNIAKPMHVGHLRSTVIGQALYNIYKHLGYNTISINHLGDWGTQFGKLIVAYNRWGDKASLEKEGLRLLNDIYARFHDEAAHDLSLQGEARDWLVKLQSGDETATTLWKSFYEISMRDFDRIYDMFGIKFDYNIGESFYSDKVQEVVDMLKEKNLLVESDGAMIVDLEAYNIQPCLIVKRDGGTLYPTHDIAAAFYRRRTFNFDKCLYVTGSEQNLHFMQLGKVIELMGGSWAKDLVHIPLGLFVMEGGKLSSRKGTTLFMEDLLNEAISKTREIIEEKNPDLENKDKVAKQVGIGAVVFNDLYNNRIKDVILSYEKILNFDGETGPYLQYTHARACSILAKLGVPDLAGVDFSLITDEFSVEVIKNIALYPDKIIESARRNEPYIVGRHLMELAKSFSKFYTNNYIINSEEDVKHARLCLVCAFKLVLESGLNLLGVAAPDKM